MEKDLHIGHLNIVKFLNKQINSGRIAHSYLFVGPESVGKVHLAKYFAKKLQGISEDNLSIEKNVDPDIIFVEPILAKKTFKKSIGIAQVHKIQQKLSLTSHSSRYKIVIIADAEYMTEEAQNAFLKTLEEPTRKSVIILTVANEGAILQTIRSRCQTVYFGLVPKKEIVAYLQKSLSDGKKIESIASLSGGKPGKAIALLDEEVYQKYVDNLKLINSLSGKEIYQKFEKAKELSEREDLINILNSWLVYFRDMLILKVGISDRLVNNWLKDEFSFFYEENSISDIEKIINEIKKTIFILSKNANPRLAMENLLLKI